MRGGKTWLVFGKTCSSSLADFCRYPIDEKSDVAVCIIMLAILPAAGGQPPSPAGIATGNKHGDLRVWVYLM